MIRHRTNYSGFRFPSVHLYIPPHEAFLGSGPKGPMSCRTQGGISRRPSVLPSFRPPPLAIEASILQSQA